MTSRSTPPVFIRHLMSTVKEIDINPCEPNFDIPHETKHKSMWYLYTTGYDFVFHAVVYGEREDEGEVDFCAQSSWSFQETSSASWGRGPTPEAAFQSMIRGLWEEFYDNQKELLRRFRDAKGHDRGSEGT